MVRRLCRQRQPLWQVPGLSPTSTTNRTISGIASNSLKPMPIVSKRQSRFFRAHANDKGKLGAVAREFIAVTPKKAFRKMPEQTKDRKSRGERWYGAKE